jgi:hypothetical protein
MYCIGCRLLLQNLVIKEDYTGCAAAQLLCHAVARISLRGFSNAVNLQSSWFVFITCCSPWAMSAAVQVGKYHIAWIAPMVWQETDGLLALLCSSSKKGLNAGA